MRFLWYKYWLWCYFNTWNFYIITFCYSSLVIAYLWLNLKWHILYVHGTYSFHVHMSFWPHKSCGKDSVWYTNDKIDQCHVVSPGVSTWTRFPIIGAVHSYPPAKCLFFIYLKGIILMKGIMNLLLLLCLLFHFKTLKKFLDSLFSN